MTARALILPGDDDNEFKRWSVAAAIVLAAHVGFMATYLLMPAPESAGAPNAPAVIVDLQPEAAAPPSQFDLAPGPEMQEAQPTPELTPPKPDVEPIPKVETPSDVTLPEQEKVEKPPEKTPVEKKPPAPKTTAAPRSEQRIAARPSAPSVGSEASRAAMATWRDLVVARLQSVKRYPSGETGQGTATVSFSVDRNGRVLSRSLVRGSGVPSLDREVLEMIQRAQPFPSFPPAMAQSVVHLAVPVHFSRH
jgi:protein TonB